MRLSLTDIFDRGTKSLAPKSLFSLHVTGQRKEDKKAGRKTGVDMQLALVLCSCPLSPEATTMSTQEATSSNSATRDQSHSAATQTGASKGKTIKHKNVKF